MMAKAPKPVIFEIDNGEDYVILWCDAKTGRVTATSVCGNYDLERSILEQHASIMADVMEAEIGERPEFDINITVDH